MQLLLGLSIEVPIVAKREDKLLLLEARALGNYRISVLKIWETGLHKIGGIFFHIPETEDEEHAAGLEVAKLENEEQLGFEGVKLFKRSLLGIGERKVFHARFLREAGKPVE